MTEFKKGLKEDFIEALNREYGKDDSWWKQIVNDEDLFIAIRDNYLDVYYQGNQVMKLSQEKGKLIGETHHRYLFGGNRYLRSHNGVIGSDQFDNVERLSSFGTDLQKIKNASRAYAGDERKGVHSIIRRNYNTIDVEVALPQKRNGQKGTAKRIDFAAFQETDGGSLELRFFEAKYFSNPELRAKNGGRPDVLKQIETYERLLKDQKGALKEAYADAIDDLLELEGIADDRKKTLKQCKDQGFEVCILPRLVIFGFDDSQKRAFGFPAVKNGDGEQKSRHQILVDGLERPEMKGKDRIEGKGKPENIVIPFQNGHQLRPSR